MKGSELGRKLSTEPFPAFVVQGLGETTSAVGLKDFLTATSLKLKTSDWAEKEIQLADLRRVMAGDYSYEQMNVWLPSIKYGLLRLGWYDSKDDMYPWNADTKDASLCVACQRKNEWNADVNGSPMTCTWVCSCGRRWWCTGHHWHQVTDPEEFDVIRQSVIATSPLPGTHL